MKNILLLLTSLFFLLANNLHAQMEINGQTRYGNEWIDFDQSYYKIVVNEDGVYKVSAQELVNAGVTLSQLIGNNLALYYRGDLVPIYVSTNGVFSSNDYIAFEGQINDGFLDRHLYSDADHMQLNSQFSLFTDESVYYLSLEDQGPKINEEANTLNGLSPETYYVHEEYINLASDPIKPTYNGSDKVRYSDFDIIEGFGSRMQKNTTLSVPTNNIFNSNQNAELEIRFGSNTVDHHVQISVNSNLIYEDEFSDYTVSHLNIPFSLSAQNNNATISLIGQNTSDNHSIAFINLKYQRQFVFEETDYLSFGVQGGQNDRYYDISSFTNSAEDIQYFDFEAGITKTISLNSGRLQFEVNNINSNKKIHLVGDNGYRSALRITDKQFFDFTQLDPEYLIITSKELRSESYQGNQMVDAYANYRASEKGGNFNVEVVEIEELYDQFIYGVLRHPSSCQNFINFLEPVWENLEFIFVIGKAVEYSDYRFEEDLNSELIPTMHVPTWGLPGSDNLLFGKRDFKSSLVPVGRIAARSAEDIDIYLDKVISHETIKERTHSVEEKQWTKKIIHLSGGDPDIQNSIFGWLQDMEAVISQDSFGAEVTTFRKSSTDLLQAADSEKILNAINGGVSIITFFGHSAVGTFDFSLEKASEYSNKDRYPLLISLGCHSGNIHAGSAGKGLSEDFVFERDKGSIAFLASSSTAYIGPQYITGRTFYENVTGEFYGKPIGSALKSYLDENEENLSIAVRTLIQQITYHGDPAISFYTSESPDYLVDLSSINQSTPVITSSDETFDFTFDVINIGRAITDSININIRHLLPDETVFSEHVIRIEAPKFKETIALTFENPGISGLGKNYLEVFVDSENEILERPSPIAEENNRLSSITGGVGYEFFIESNVARPVSPAEFAIINEPNVSLIASTTNVFSEQTEYIMQIDTSELFEAPLEETSLIKSGGKIQWSPSITLDEETVYYWRISPNNIDSDKIWYTSSFTYIPNVGQGWNQGHYYQFLKDDFDGIDLPAHDQMQFDTSGFFISITNKVFDPENLPCLQFDFGNCVTSIRPWNFMYDGGVAIVVADKVTGSGWINENGGDYESIEINSLATYRVFGYKTDTPEERKKVMDFLEIIPDSNYVYFMTIFNKVENDIKVEEWESDSLLYGKSILSLLDEQGAGFTDELIVNKNVPYTFIYEKGIKPIAEDIGTSILDDINTTFFVPVRGTNGLLESTLIGPANAWNYLSWDLENIESQDSIALTVTGIDDQGKSTLLDIFNNPGEFDLSEISANVYPFLKLEYFALDNVNRTAPNLNHLRVYHQKAPEAIFNTEEDFVFNSDTLNQGQFLNFRANVENITGEAMSDLLVHYKIIDEENNEIFNAKIDEPIDAFGNINIDFNFSTDQLIGDYLFVVEFNPDFEQAEQFIFNNIGIRQFHVKRNQLNPLLNVQFDQTRIRDGDIVSPSPVIDVRLYDNNEFLLNQDPNNFQQAIIFEDGTRIDYDYPSINLEFFPGTLENENVPMMRLIPDLLDEGNYKFVAQAKDATGTFSGTFAYEVDFRVVSNSCIPSFYNYPNPFHESTTFEYSLTGTNLPESIDIDIYDGRGQIVRRITDGELNTYGIGNNRILYTWDGKSENGSQLANGVYYYRLILNGLTNNQSFKNCGDLEAQLGGKLILMN